MKISLLSLLTVLFVGLKLTGYINWSWWLVLLPSIISVIVPIFIILIIAWASTK